MNTRLLVDAIVRQTTVLIAELSTAAGIRAPLAHVADRVFLDLSREIEAQGVSRKVAADMFGLAIRTYQKKVQRVTEAAQSREQTLWQSVLARLNDSGSMTRRALLDHFRREDPIVVGSVVNDLVSSGLVYRTGSGEGAVFGVTGERDLAQAVREQRRESLDPIIWVMIYRNSGITRAELSAQLAIEPADLETALAQLEQGGLIECQGIGAAAVFRAGKFLVPVDAEHGWEAAVFDHFQAVVRAIGLKLRSGVPRSVRDDVVGGATLSFDLCDGHPYLDEALALLRKVRAEVNELWTKVQTYNESHPICDEDKIDVSFYFGQSVVRSNEE
jgi:hypothetical protein